MEYNKEVAKEIIKKFGLHRQADTNWKLRGKIPDKYLKEGFEVKAKIAGEADEQALCDIRRILGYKKINASSLARLVGVSEQRMKDMVLAKMALKKDEQLKTKKAITLLRIEAKKLLDELSRRREVGGLLEKRVRAFFMRPEIHTTVFFQSNATGAKFNRWVNGKRQLFPVDELDELTAALMVFVTETAML